MHYHFFCFLFFLHALIILEMVDRRPPTQFIADAAIFFTSDLMDMLVFPDIPPERNPAGAL